MICIILAAGYATRLYPLTENFPKPLLEIKGKSILDHLLDDLDKSGKISKYVVVSNHRYFEHFENWRKNKTLKGEICVLDDGSVSNETRLGAVKDVMFAIEKENINDDVVVIAGDNVLDFSLCSFLDFFEEKQATCVMRYFEGNTEKLKKCGVVQIADDGEILDMEEKPANPKSNWCVPPFYVYAKRNVGMVKKGIDEGCGTDAPGSFIAWLCKETTVYAMQMPGSRFDIGNLESYENAKQTYKGIVK